MSPNSICAIDTFIVVAALVLLQIYTGRKSHFLFYDLHGIIPCVLFSSPIFNYLVSNSLFLFSSGNSSGYPEIG